MDGCTHVAGQRREHTQENSTRNESTRVRLWGTKTARETQRNRQNRTRPESIQWGHARVFGENYGRTRVSRAIYLHTNRSSPAGNESSRPTPNWGYLGKQCRDRDETLARGLAEHWRTLVGGSSGLISVPAGGRGVHETSTFTRDSVHETSTFTRG